MAKTISGREITSGDGIKTAEGYYIAVEKDSVNDNSGIFTIENIKRQYEADKSRYDSTKSEFDLRESALVETSVRLNNNNFTIAESSLLEYYPNKHQVEDYVNKAKAVELDLAKERYLAVVKIYEFYVEETVEWPGFSEVRRPIKLVYNSIENPEVEKILIANGISEK